LPPVRSATARPLAASVVAWALATARLPISTAVLAPDARLAAMSLAFSPGVTEANSAGTACSLAWASATATSASARANSEGATVMRAVTGIRGSSAALSTIRICVPRFAAWRRRWAISG